MTDGVPPPQADMRERILAAAFTEFMEHGYAGAGTMDIARRARVSKRDLYAQFGSKQAMLTACIASRAERMQAPLALPKPGNRTELRAVLTAFGTRLLTEVSRPEVMATYRLAILESHRAPEVARTLDQLGRQGSEGALGRLISAAQEAGLLAAGDPASMAPVFLALLWSGGLLPQMLLRVAEPLDEMQAKQRAEQAADLFLRMF